MLTFVDYFAIGGTVLILGSAVLSFLAVCVINVYLMVRYSINDHNRWVTYAKSEAPRAFVSARLWRYRFTLGFVALTAAYVLFMLFVFGVLKDA